MTEQPLRKTKATSRSTQQEIDPSAWVDQYGDYLFRYAYSRLRDTNAAEEVVQETFLSGVKYSEQYSGRGTERAWLLGILKRKIVDFVRQRAKHHLAEGYEDEKDPTARMFDAAGNWKTSKMPKSLAPDRKLEMDELWSIVEQCLENLPKGQADVFMLSVMEDMQSSEICQELEISPSNFWVRMHRARLGLARCVGLRWDRDEQNDN